jgi:hypothetical protein
MNKKIRIETHITDIILFDIVNYSLLSDEDQWKTIHSMSQKIEEFLPILCGQSFLKIEEVILGFVPTGDGAFLILDHKFAGYGLFTAISLRTSLLQLKSQTNNLFSGLRVAINFGAVLPIEDLTRKTNFVGSGLNDCARLFCVGKEDIEKQKHIKDQNYIIISDSAFQQFKEEYPSGKIDKFLEVIKFEIGDEVVFR